MTPLDFIDYLLCVINDSDRKAADETVELIKREIEEYLQELDEAEDEAQGYTAIAQAAEHKWDIEEWLLDNGFCHKCEENSWSRRSYKSYGVLRECIKMDDFYVYYKQDDDAVWERCKLVDTVIEGDGYLHLPDVWDIEPKEATHE